MLPFKYLTSQQVHSARTFEHHPAALLPLLCLEATYIAFCNGHENMQTVGTSTAYMFSQGKLTLGMTSRLPWFACMSLLPKITPPMRLQIDRPLFFFFLTNPSRRRRRPHTHRLPSSPLLSSPPFCPILSSILSSVLSSYPSPYYFHPATAETNTHLLSIFPIHRARLVRVVEWALLDRRITGIRAIRRTWIRIGRIGRTIYTH